LTQLFIGKQFSFCLAIN